MQIRREILNLSRSLPSFTCMDGKEDRMGQDSFEPSLGIFNSLHSVSKFHSHTAAHFICAASSQLGFSLVRSVAWRVLAKSTEILCCRTG